MLRELGAFASKASRLVWWPPNPRRPGKRGNNETYLVPVLRPGARPVAGLAAAAPSQPNIVFLFDDMGYGQPQSYNPQSALRTPNSTAWPGRDAVHRRTLGVGRLHAPPATACSPADIRGASAVRRAGNILPADYPGRPDDRRFAAQAARLSPPPASASGTSG